MRAYIAALLIAIGTFFGIFVFNRIQEHRLNEFCTNLPLATEIAKVREMAQEHGFQSTMEPHSQMRIELTGVHISPPKCRVFFNQDRNVEYRIWQQS